MHEVCNTEPTKNFKNFLMWCNWFFLFLIGANFPSNWSSQTIFVGISICYGHWNKCVAFHATPPPQPRALLHVIFCVAYLSKFPPQTQYFVQSREFVYLLKCYSNFNSIEVSYRAILMAAKLQSVVYVYIFLGSIVHLYTAERETKQIRNRVHVSPSNMCRVAVVFRA